MAEIHNRNEPENSSPAGAAAPLNFRPKLWNPPAAAGLDLTQKVSTLQDRIRGIAQRFERIKMASSLAVEDMVVTDMLCKLGVQAEIFTLQTGMLNAETLDLIGQIQAHWGIELVQYTPSQTEVEAYVRQHGKHAFYDSVALRRECCRIRKVEPLGRALQDAQAWLTGQRREQSVTRAELPFEETDRTHGIAKFNPIFDWTEPEVWSYVREHELPVNTLYNKGYPSIGCEPCTRPVKEGEPLRAGRWWWENQDSKECGLHR